MGHMMQRMNLPFRFIPLRLPVPDNVNQPTQPDTLKYPDAPDKPSIGLHYLLILAVGLDNGKAFIQFVGVIAGLWEGL